MRRCALLRQALAAAALLAAALCSAAAGFGEPGGPPPAGLDDAFTQLRADPYDMELLLSFGTSKGGSAGHLALALREPGSDDDTVYSANFYADREPEACAGFLHRRADDRRAEAGIPVRHATRRWGPPPPSAWTTARSTSARSSASASQGVPLAEREALRAFFAQLNDDYRARAPSTAYHGGEITYDYMNLNCAKTIGAAFRHGAGYDTLEVRDPLPLASALRAIAAVSANIPTEMALKLVEQWPARGYAWTQCCTASGPIRPLPMRTTIRRGPSPRCPTASRRCCRWTFAPTTATTRTRTTCTRCTCCAT